MLKDDLLKLKDAALADLGKIKDPKSLEDFGIKYFGRKDGELTKILRGLKDLAIEERKIVGELANTIKRDIEAAVEEFRGRLAAESAPAIDLTISGIEPQTGHLHPITQFMRKVMDIFISMGFDVVDGPEVETEKYNFDLLNIPADHPARDMWDTFYIRQSAIGLQTSASAGGGSAFGGEDRRPKTEDRLLLRTHTSPVQLRAMETRKPPVRLIVPGRVFRREATDAGHETNFYQCEGLVIDENVSMANLIATLDVFLKKIFGEKTKVRVRPSFFPFVEPGIEVDISCLICGGKGCSSCKKSGWVEVLGAGMVHPVVLKNMGVDPEKYTGFAFGLGIDRFAALYYGINDIRLSYSGDLRFIRQF